MALRVVPIGGEPTVPTAARSSRVGQGVGVFLLAVATLLAGCGKGVDDHIRLVYELGRQPTEPNKNRIAGMATDDDRDVRATVLVVMESIDPARAGLLAKAAVEDHDGLVRAAAVGVLAEQVATDPGLVPRLARLSGEDPDWQVRRRALEAIAAAHDPVVSEAFTRALSDSVRHVRLAALRAGADHPGLLPVARLAQLVVDDPDWENRVEAARALAGSGDPAAFAGLDAARHDPNEFVRSAAVRERRALLAAGVAEPPPPPSEGKP